MTVAVRQALVSAYFVLFVWFGCIYLVEALEVVLMINIIFVNFVLLNINILLLCFTVSVFSNC